MNSAMRMFHPEVKSRDDMGAATSDSTRYAATFVKRLHKLLFCFSGESKATG